MSEPISDFSISGRLYPAGLCKVNITDGTAGWQRDRKENAQIFSKNLLSLNSTDEINRFLCEEMKKRYPSDFPQNSN